MKKIFLLAAAAIIAAGSMQAAKSADSLRIYINPGHGSWGPNDRPCATIPYPNLPETGMPDTCGFYESNTDLWKCMKLGTTLEKMGVKPANIMYSRIKNGPYPYTKDNYDPNEIYNRKLSEICEEVEANNMDMFISIHSNAAGEGTTANFPLFLYRGQDGEGGDKAPGSRAMSAACWAPHWMDEIDPQSYYSKTQMDLRGDWDFYGSHSVATRSNGKQYDGYLGVLKHGTPGYLLEGFMHTYQPARHRALNQDYCNQEGVRVARGVCDYWGLTPEKTGYIMGTVKDIHEKIVNDLFRYAPNTNDQWLPLNGATVNLLKDGKVVKSYAVDTLYNGVFVFEDLEPGDYTLQATAPGYKAQGDYTKNTTSSEYQALVATSLAPYTVKANETTYAKLYLESQSYVPPAVTYTNYPDPVQPSYAAVPEKFEMAQSNVTYSGIKGEIKRAIVRGDSTLVLTNEGVTPHIYVFNNVKGTLVKEMSMNGIAAADTTNAGFISVLNDIAFTADGQIVGVNAERCQYSDGQVDAGYKRGTVRVYKWQDVDADPTEWFTTQSSNNFYRCDMGASLAVSGSAYGDDESKVVIAGINAGGTFKGMRFLINTVASNTVVSSVFSEKTINASSNFTGVRMGMDPQLTVSPLADNKMVIDGSLQSPFEFQLATTSNTDSEITGRLADSQLGAGAKGVSFFKYAKHALMAAPYVTNDAVAGIKLYDVTAGIDSVNAKLIATTNTDLAATNPGAVKQLAEGQLPFMSSGAKVSGTDVTLIMMVDTVAYTFTTKNVAQPGVQGAYAYDLNRTQGDEQTTLTFKLTTDAEGATVVLTPRDGGDAITVPVANVVKGENTVTIDNSQLTPNVKYDWKVVVANKANSVVGPFFKTNNTTGRGLAMDLSPESPYFGNLYVGDPYNAGKKGKGIYEYTPDLQAVNEEPYFASIYNTNTNTASPFRMAVNPNDGVVYITDWSDAHAGLWQFNPADTQNLGQFFEGTKESSGRYVNNGVAVGGGTTGVAFVGIGDSTKMVTFVEDYPTGNNGQTLCVYNIGTKTSWGVEPSATLPTVSGLMANTNVNIIADEQGMWVAQIRGAGNNATTVPSFVYCDYDDNVLLNSGDVLDLNGSWGSGIAINADKTLLAVANESANIQVYKVTWNGNTPSLALDYTVTYPGSGNIVNQIVFDPAGNMFCGNRYQSYGFTLPREDGETATTPAKTALYIEVTNATGVNDVTNAKTVKSVNYVNMAGQVSATPFEGVNIVVTRYTDGTQSTKKIVK